MKNQSLKLFLFAIFISEVCMAGKFDKVVISSDGNAYVNLITREGSFNVMRYNHLKHSTTSYYLIPDQPRCHINSVSIDLTSDKVAYFEGCTLAHTISSGVPARGFYRLSILDIKSHKPIASFVNAGELFSFSPEGDAIVYAEEIPGEYGSPAPPGYKGGLWIYNFSSRDKYLIHPYKGSFNDVNWSEHDGNIYIQVGQQVLKYSVTRGIIEQVHYKGIYFSHDGKYNSDACVGDGRGSYLYETNTNQRMIEWENIIADQNDHKGQPRSSAAYGYNKCFQFWSHYLGAGIFSVGNTKNVIFDIKQGKIIGIFDGHVIGTNSEGTLAAVYPKRPNQPDSFDNTKVEIINLLDLIKK